LLEQTSQWVLIIARAVAAEALDQDGGLAYEGRDGVVINSGREWWPQAEAILGFWRAYRITGEERYANIAARLWNFIQRRMVDRVQGEWFWRVFADGSVDQMEPKISEWKDPYHGVRMCLQMLRFLET
jgi:cellobiose epimerase